MVWFWSKSLVYGLFCSCWCGTLCGASCGVGETKEGMWWLWFIRVMKEGAGIHVEEWVGRGWVAELLRRGRVMFQAIQIGHACVSKGIHERCWKIPWWDFCHYYYDRYCSDDQKSCLAEESRRHQSCLGQRWWWVDEGGYIVMILGGLWWYFRHESCHGNPYQLGCWKGLA